MATYAQPLSASRMREVLGAIMAGQVPAEEIRAFLAGLAERGETAEEIATAVEVLRAHAVPLPLASREGVCDTCGTGGDGQGTVNVSTLAALAAAAGGVRVAKHGNRAASSRCGSADLLEALGWNLAATPGQVARSIDTLGFGFCFAPAFHPAMKAVAQVRKALGIRTLFNLVGPLANPAPLSFQLVGVSEARLLRPMAEALAQLGIRHGLVVHGTDGMDEATTTGETLMCEVQHGRVTEGRFTPAEAGVPTAQPSALRGGEPAANARIARDVLAGSGPPPIRDLVALNAGCALYVAGRSPSIAEGVRLAQETLRSGRAARLLEAATRQSWEPV